MAVCGLQRTMDQNENHVLLLTNHSMINSAINLIKNLKELQLTNIWVKCDRKFEINQGPKEILFLQTLLNKSAISYANI